MILKFDSRNLCLPKIAIALDDDDDGNDINFQSFFEESIFSQIVIKMGWIAATYLGLEE